MNLPVPNILAARMRYFTSLCLSISLLANFTSRVLSHGTDQIQTAKKKQRVQ